MSNFSSVSVVSPSILLGVTGGIAAYKSAELTRLLKKVGWTVQVAMTPAATEFITPLTLQALSGQAVLSSQWQADSARGMPHIDASRQVDVMLIAPATADFIAKLAHGVADDLLSTLCLARACPLLIAPAMNKQMWENPATQRNIAQCRADGILILGPDSGEQACGEVGMGCMLAPEVLCSALEYVMQPKPLLGQKILLTAGPTFEAIDPVRGITNLSSGKMGYALAQAAAEAGAEVLLISGPTALAVPYAVTRISVQSAAEMRLAVLQNCQQQAIFIAVAAVADYRVAQPSAEKIKKQGHSSMTLDLIANPDILAEIANLPNPPFCVGFAAESQALLQQAEAKRKRKGVPLLVANLVQHALGQEDNQVTLFDDAGIHPLDRAPKLVLARQIMQHITRLFLNK